MAENEQWYGVVLLS